MRRGLDLMEGDFWLIARVVKTYCVDIQKSGE
jgi:hypothetical protein